MDAAERRRQRILARGQDRLDLLLGVKKNEDFIKNGVEPVDLNAEPNSEQIMTSGATKNHQNVLKEEEITRRTESTESLRNRHHHHHQGQSTPAASTPPPARQEESNENNATRTQANTTNKNTLSRFNFNGYSNIEMAILSSMAVIVSLLLHLDMAYLFYDYVFLPFFTFELAHLLIHYNYMPTTNGQFQMFTLLLQLCGIPKRSLSRLISVLNFLFILIDNFVIYFITFVFSTVLFNSIALKQLFVVIRTNE